MAEKQVTQDDSRKKLRGQDDFIRWYTTFRAASKTQDTWELFDGSEAILLKPDRSLYVVAPSGTPVADTASVVTDATASTTKATGVEVARRDFDYKQGLDMYKEDKDEYTEQRKRIDKAMAFLHERVDEVYGTPTRQLQQAEWRRHRNDLRRNGRYQT
jgi:hypothetical protein